MKEKLENKYIAWGLTIFSVFAALILLFFAIYRWEYIAGFIETLVVIMMPFIFGLAISYMMSPVLKFFEGKVFDPLLKKKFKKKFKVGLCLSGGGTRGFSFLGAFKAFEEYGIDTGGRQYCGKSFRNDY